MIYGKNWKSSQNYKIKIKMWKENTLAYIQF